ncbi:MAG: hypothetical protein AB2L18_05710 [Anaerolineaceae bacterium]
MDAKTVRKYQPYTDLAMQLDTLRAGKFVNPNDLKKSMKVPELNEILHVQIKKWDTIMETLDKTFAKKIFWVKLIDNLRWFEIPTLTAYLCVVAMALFKSVQWAEDLSFPVTLVVFIYLIITRVSIMVLVDNQAKKLQQQFKTSIPNYSEKLRKTVNEVIMALDNILLNMSEGGSDYRIKLRSTDYTGVTYIIKPSKAGPEVLDAYPFPFHAKLDIAKNYVHIIMTRRDDKLIQALANVPKYTEIQMVVIRQINEQKSFPKFIDALKKIHNRFSMRVMDAPVTETNGVQVLLPDSIWKLDMRPSSGYLRLPYLLVEDDKEKADYESLFNNLWFGSELPESS